MNEAKHTAEPWYYDGDGVYSTKDCEGAPLAHMLTMGYDSDLNHIDARRIVACVNACAGVPTELLEEYPAPFSEMRNQRDQLQARVNELETQELSWRVAYLDERKTANKLLAALKGLMEIHDNPAPFSGKTGEDRILMLERQAAKTHAAVSAARAAIAAVEGGQ